jgi:hypothetical protein
VILTNALVSGPVRFTVEQWRTTPSGDPANYGFYQFPVLMTSTSTVITVDPRATVTECMKVMTTKRIRHLPIMENGELVGRRDPAEKTALAIECGVRHHTLALTVAVTNFGIQRALLVLVPCICTFVAIAMLYLAGRARSLARAAPGARDCPRD